MADASREKNAEAVGQEEKGPSARKISDEEQARRSRRFWRCATAARSNRDAR